MLHACSCMSRHNHPCLMDPIGSHGRPVGCCMLSWRVQTRTYHTIARMHAPHLSCCSSSAGGPVKTPSLRPWHPLCRLSRHHLPPGVEAWEPERCAGVCDSGGQIRQVHQVCLCGGALWQRRDHCGGNGLVVGPWEVGGAVLWPLSATCKGLCAHLGVAGCGTCAPTRRPAWCPPARATCL